MSDRKISVENRIGVIGLGNVLMGDDAFGPYMIRMLEAGYEYPSRVVLLDLGTPSVDLFNYLDEFDTAIVIDCVASKGQAGEVRTYSRAEILQNPILPRITPHEPGLKEALLLADFQGQEPKHVILVGVIPESTRAGLEMSAPVMNAIPHAIGVVVDELVRLGIETRPRRVPMRPDIWWRRASERAEADGETR